MKLHFLILLLLFCLPALAHADDAIDPKYFTNWGGVTDLLRIKGIDPTRLNWTPIQSMCLPLKTDDDETAYNRCCYEKAYTEFQFGENSAYCNDEISDQFPDSLLDAQKTRTYTETDSDGRARVVQESVKLYNSLDELQGVRRNAFRDCMRSYGWENPNDWGAGRHLPVAAAPEDYLQAPAGKPPTQ